MKSGKIITISCLAALCIFMVLLIFMQKSDFSDKENRFLATFPEFSPGSVKSGEFMDGLKDYVTDHFPFRDFWITVKTEAEIIMGKREINGIYICSDDYLIKEYEKPENTDRIVDTFNAAASRMKEINPNITLRLMLVPTAVSIYDSKLPAFASSSALRQIDDMRMMYERVDIEEVDVSDLLISNADNESPLYYKSDHHWSGYGAYLGYKAYMESIGMEAASLGDFATEDVTHDFHGTLSAKVNRALEKGDTITLYDNPSARLRVEYSDTGVVADTLYNLDYLNKRDKYSLFLDNAHPLVTITNENAAGDRVLMLIKDSYANCVVPFLAGDFAKIYVFDTRYYKEGPSYFLAENHDITDVLILYNMNTIDTDAGIRGIY